MRSRKPHIIRHHWRVAPIRVYSHVRGVENGERWIFRLCGWVMLLIVIALLWRGGQAIDLFPASTAWRTPRIDPLRMPRPTRLFPY